MKIGICVRAWSEKGGIGVYTRSLVRAMLAMDHDNTYLLIYHHEQDAGQFGHRHNVKERVVTAPGKFLWDHVAAPLVAAREGVDVLFHTKFSVPLLATCKTVMTAHGSERFVHPEFSHKSDLLFFRTIYPWYLRNATAILAVSENTRRDIIRFQNVDPHKIKTVYLAASSQFRKIHNPTVLRAVQEKYGLPLRFILHVGLLYPGKNLPNLLRAMSVVRQTEPIKLVLAGTGRRMYRDDLKLIDQLGLADDVIYTGYVPHEDLAAVYSLAEMLVFPSYYESFGLPILEAMMCECPVVTTMGAAVPEVAGDAAVFVDPRDPGSIADGIHRVLSDASLRQELIDKGLKNASRFSWEKAARETLNVLTSLTA
jgi:glycosyltransferase involved in cell wall biosynthesis